MLALIYLALAIYLGDLLCRRFYRFVSIPHRWAAAILVGILLSTWLTYLAGLAFAHTAEPLLSADILFFVVASGASFWLSRKAPKLDLIAVRAPGSSRWDWITLAALSAAACVLLFGTLYVNKQGALFLSGTRTNDFATQLTFAQSVAVVNNFPIAVPYYVAQGIDKFLFYFQAGNLEFLGLNLAWSVDVLSVLGHTSMLALVMALGELLFHSRVVGRLGATFFFFHGFLERLINFLAAGYLYRDQNWGFWKQIAFVNARHVPFATGIILLVLIFLVDQYRAKLSAAGASSNVNTAWGESEQGTSQNRRNTGLPSTITSSGRPALISPKGFLFSGLLVAALPPLDAGVFIATTVVMCCLFVAYGCWRLSKLKTAAILGQALGSTLTACILAAGVMDLLVVYNGSRVEVKYDNESLVKGLVFRRSLIYKIPGSFSPSLARAGLLKLAVTAFEGGYGNGKGQSKNPRGIASDSAGNIFVADTGNGRIEKFSPDGNLLSTMGNKGSGRDLAAPTGIAVDRSGNIYIANDGTHRVLKVKPDGALIAEWKGPDPGFYGPRRIAVGPDDSVYVVDQGHARIVKFGPDGEVLTTWGGGGSGDGQFKDPASVAVDPDNNKVYVADPINSRIQVFDSDGKFLTKWSVPEWGQPAGFEDLTVDCCRNLLYASSAHMDSVLVFDLNGTRLGNLMPPPPDKLQEPSGLALFGSKLYVLCFSSNRVVQINLQSRFF
jgi:DNA-binding beta-propeller fold protein YncE